MELTYNIERHMNTAECISYLDKKRVCSCKINIDNNKWSITSWYTESNYKNQGYGTKTMKALVQYMADYFGIPKGIEYVWNGANSYVYDWISKNFNAICKCPLAVLKSLSDDDWESHIYILNTTRFLEYFNLG